MPFSVVSETKGFGSDNRERYRELKDEWWGVPDVFERQDVIEVRQPVTRLSHSPTHMLVSAGAPSH